MQTTHTTLWIAVASVMAACATGPADKAVLTERVGQSLKNAEQRLAERATPIADNLVTYREESWIGLRKVVKSERDTSKAKLDAIEIEINQTFSSLNDIAGILTAMTGTPVYLDPDVLSSTSGSQMGASLQTGTSSGFGGASGAAPGRTFGQSAVPTGAITASSPFTVNFRGTLTGFMNLAAAYYGISWKSEASGVRFFTMESRTFRVFALPGDTRLAAGIDSTGSSGGTGGTQSGSATTGTGVAFSGLSVWTAMEAAVKQISSATGKVVASPATGTISVTDTPAVLARVAEFIDAQNKSLNRQVSVNVRVLAVTINDEDHYGINWDAVYQNLGAGGPFSLKLKSSFAAAEGASLMTLSIPSTSTTSLWAGTNAIINALSTQGRVSELTSATLVTLNNQPAPVNVGLRTTYLASSSTTASTTAGVAPTTTLTPGTVNTGFSMSIVPHILEGRELLLQYSMDLSSLVRLDSISSGLSTIQIPKVATNNFLQRVRMQSGDTLVVAGFDQDKLNAEAKGIGSPDNPIGGQRDGANSRTLLVVLIQPNLAL